MRSDARKRDVEASYAAFRVQGRCPSCGSESLFLGMGGFVTCSWIECRRPDHASDMLERGELAPIVALAEQADRQFGSAQVITRDALWAAIAVARGEQS